MDAAVLAVRPAGHRRVAARTALPWLLLSTIAALGVSGVVLMVAADVAVGGPGYHTWGMVAFGLTFPVLPLMGLLLTIRRPEHPLGWLFLGSAVAMAIAAFAHGYGEFAVEAYPGSLPGADLVLVFGGLGWLGFAIPALFVPLLYPDGHYRSQRWRAVGAGNTVLLVVAAVAVLIDPGTFEHFPIVENPIGLPGGDSLVEATQTATDVLLVAAFVLCACSLLLRYRAAGATLRLQLTWLVGVVAVLIAVEILGAALLPGDVGGRPVVCSWADGPASGSLLGTTLPMLLYVGIPVAVAVAVLRHNLYDVDRFLRRWMVYVVLWAAIAVAYTAVAWLLGVAVTDQLPLGVGVLITIAATVLFHPARQRLERLADRWVFGDRRRGYVVASDLGDSLGRADGLDGIAGSLAETARRAAGLRWASVTLALGSDEVTADAGDPELRAQLTVPVRHRDLTYGSIRCGPPVQALRLRVTDRDLLALLARQSALAVHTLGLAEELTASRARIVAAAESERRRLERDIHDGAQQELVAIIAKARLARDLLGHDAAAAAATLEDLGRDARGALVGIRELAQGIRPSVLADRGLVAAIEDRTARLPLEIVVVADAATRAARLPEAVEGAAYFVVGEALANVLKHAQAGCARVAVHRDPAAVSVEIADDGRGFDPDRCVRTGLTSLGDRVGALGGMVTVRSAPGAGTTLLAILPIEGEAARE